MFLSFRQPLCNDCDTWTNTKNNVIFLHNTFREQTWRQHNPCNLLHNPTCPWISNPGTYDLHWSLFPTLVTEYIHEASILFTYNFPFDPLTKFKEFPVQIANWLETTHDSVYQVANAIQELLNCLMLLTLYDLE